MPKADAHSCSSCQLHNPSEMPPPSRLLHPCTPSEVEWLSTTPDPVQVPVMALAHPRPPIALIWPPHIRSRPERPHVTRPAAIAWPVPMAAALPSCASRVPSDALPRADESKAAASLGACDGSVEAGSLCDDGRPAASGSGVWGAGWFTRPPSSQRCEALRMWYIWPAAQRFTASFVGDGGAIATAAASCCVCAANGARRTVGDGPLAYCCAEVVRGEEHGGDRE